MALVWNLAEAQQPAGIPGASGDRNVAGSPRQLDIHFVDAAPGARVHVSFVDQERGSPVPAWRAMGSPRLPTLAQIDHLRRAADIAPPQVLRLDSSSRISLSLPPEGVALIQVL